MKCQCCFFIRIFRQLLTNRLQSESPTLGTIIFQNIPHIIFGFHWIDMIFNPFVFFKLIIRTYCALMLMIYIVAIVNFHLPNKCTEKVSCLFVLYCSQITKLRLLDNNHTIITSSIHFKDRFCGNIIIIFACRCIIDCDIFCKIVHHTLNDLFVQQIIVAA